MLIAFVGKENECAEAGERGLVQLAAGHVTAGVQADEFLLRVKAFMARVFRGDVPCEEQPEKRGSRTGFWREDGGGKGDGQLAEFSMVAPLKLVEEGRQRIPRDQWQ